jgi:hypothetical protein
MSPEEMAGLSDADDMAMMNEEDMPRRRNTHDA